MPSASKLLAIFLLGQTAFAAAVPHHLARRSDDTNLDVAAPFQASAPLMIRAAAPRGARPPSKPGRPGEPADPTSQEPTDPGSQEPTDPGSQEPTDPGSETPTDPGSQTPTDPNAPTKPSSGGEPTAPEEPTDPNAPACKGKRSGTGCGGSDSATPNTPVGRLGARRSGDGIADTTARSISDIGYQESDTPPSSPDAPAVDGGLTDVKAQAPPGSALHDLKLTGYTKTLIRGAGNSPNDAPILNMQTETTSDMHAIVETKDKGHDSTPKENQLPFSEVIGQELDKKFDGNFGGKLKALTQYHVANKPTEDLLAKHWDGLQKMGEAGAVPRDLTEGSAWSDLANSANGGALFRYSNDHYDRLEGWQPVRAEVYRQDLGFDGIVFWHITWVYGPQP